MKTFAQFFSAPGREAVGTSQVALLDGRRSIATNATIARSLCRAGGFTGFEIRKGESFTHFTTIRKVEYIR